MTVKKIHQTFSGKRYWTTSMFIPLDLVHDDNFMDRTKVELKEICIKEYLKNCKDSFKYTITSDRVSHNAEVKLEIEDLFELKNENNRLKKEMREILDKYRALLNSMEKKNV